MTHSKYEREFATRFAQLGTDLPPYIEEYQFSDRKFRFDFAWPEPQHKVAVEVDGGNNLVVYSRKLKRHVAVGRHTKMKDYEKLNLATSLGWRVLRITPEMLRKDPLGVMETLKGMLIKEDAK